MGQSKDSLQRTWAGAIVPIVNPTLIVQKYGGTSLGTPDRIREIAGRIAGRAADGTRIIVTVSAMGHTTDELLELARQVTDNPSQRELDMLLTVGERVSMALLSMALNAINCDAVSFTGSQSGIVTSIRHNRALIEEIKGDRIREALGRGRVVIVAGFQGVSREREITTLGRGGSDTTAVALAATLGAAQCEIYSDYPGVFTADPRWVPSARAIPTIGYDEMLELAALGALVLHYRAAELARRYKVTLRLASSFGDQGETMVGDMASMEKATATSVTCNPEVASLRINAKHEDALASLIERITADEIRILCYHRDSHDGPCTLHLVVAGDDVASISKAAAESGLDVTTRDDVATVSLIGSGLTANSAAVFDVERALAQAGIPVVHTEKSALSVTCLIPASDCKRAVQTLHTKFIEK